MGALNNLLSRIPWLLLAVGYCGWLGYGYYDWLNSPTSPLGQRKVVLHNAQQALNTAKVQLKLADDFYKNLNILREKIRQLSAELEGTKAVLNTDIDIANFVRMITLEAKKLRLVIKGIQPNPEVKKDYYIEVPYTVQLKGAYVQVLIFFDRIAKLQQVIRVGDFKMKPSGSTATKYVELEGSAKILAYKYLGTKADEVTHNPELQSSEEKTK